MDHLGYDKTDPLSIESYGKRLVGKTFADVCREDDIKKAMVVRDASDYEDRHGDKKRKGGLGELIEERYFHYAANNDAKPDFEEAGVELKVTPYKINKNKSIAAKERLILTMIDYFSVVDEKFEESKMWEKSKLILLVYYLYEQSVEDRLDYKIGYVKLFAPPRQDIKIIEHDFYMIAEKIRAGKAHELSESDTIYLGAVPKAATSKNRKKQPFSDEPAKPRAFAFKGSYMTYVLNQYIIPGKNTYEPIIKDFVEGPFEQYVVEKVYAYRGYTVEEICAEFHVKDDKKPKNLEALLAYRILGIRGNHAEEFEKANIVVKTIRIEKNNTIKESMSFPTFKFQELIQEEWETSTFGNYLRETRFFFVVYQYDAQDRLRLKGCRFWNMPYHDLEQNVRDVWMKTRHRIIDGLQICEKNGRHYSNLPKPSEDPICHVRPHGQNAKDTDELPDGRCYPKQCFWLKNTYILSQLEDLL